MGINQSTGYTGNDIVSRVVNYVGNTSSSFKTYVQQTVPIAIFRFCKMHDWSFLRKTGLTLTTVTGQAEYDLTVANIGFLMASSDVEVIRAEADGVVMKRVDLNQIRRFDAENADGSSNDTPSFWAAVGDNTIRIWPPTVKAMSLKIDGKITPTVPDPDDMSSSSSVPIPYKYQESLIEYVIALALDRENDDRAPVKKQESMALIRSDILDDMRNLGETENPRIKSLFESRFDGLNGNNDVPGFNVWDD
jgi:hypothetical protein